MATYQKRYKQNYPESIPPNYILAVKIQSLWQISLSSALITTIQSQGFHLMNFPFSARNEKL